MSSSVRSRRPIGSDTVALVGHNPSMNTMAGFLTGRRHFPGYPTGGLCLIEGDGSLMMHTQELDTIKRHGIRLLMAIINDGGYGAEFHKFRANNIDPSGAIHGRGDIAAMARGFGLAGATVDQAGSLDGLFKEHQGANVATVWDIIADDLIPSRSYRRVHYGEA